MSKAEESKSKHAAAQELHKSNPLARIGRRIACVLTMGMAFPNAFSENVDIVDYEARATRSK